MQPYAEVCRDEENQDKPELGAKREANMQLADAQSFKVNFSGAEEPDDTVMVMRICGKVLRLSRCEFFQLIYLILTVFFVAFMLMGILTEQATK